MGLKMSSALQALSMGKTAGHIFISQMEEDTLDAETFNLTAEVNSAKERFAPKGISLRDRESWAMWYERGIAKAFADYVD